MYADELKAFEAAGVMRLVTAFSRVKAQRRCYVQDEVYARRDEVWQMMQDGAVIYVCGDASRMAPDVRRTLAAIESEKTGKSPAEAEQWLNELTVQNRYLVDVWASN